MLELHQYEWLSALPAIAMFDKCQLTWSLLAAVRRKRLRLTPSKAAEAPAAAGAPADAQGGGSAQPDGTDGTACPCLDFIEPAIVLCEFSRIPAQL